MFWYFLSNKSPLDRKIPWMTYKSVFWLKNNIKPGYIIFEWGSGGSTLFFENKKAKVFSVEHDKEWFDKVKPLLNKKLTTYTLAIPTQGKTHKSSDKNYKNLSFKNYCNLIKRFPDNYFDFVSVDGRARNSCIKQSISKVKNGGYLILDNSEREEYLKGIELLKGWKRIDFFGRGPLNKYPWLTSIFQKPFS